jgi:hypothetical protein
MKFVSFVLAFVLTQSVYAVPPNPHTPRGHHLRTTCVNLDDATDFEFVDSLSLLLYTTRTSYLISVEPCQALDVAMGIGFGIATPGKLCANDYVRALGDNSVILQSCKIVSIVPIKNAPR